MNMDSPMGGCKAWMTLLKERTEGGRHGANSEKKERERGGTRDKGQAGSKLHAWSRLSFGPGACKLQVPGSAGLSLVSCPGSGCRERPLAVRRERDDGATRRVLESLSHVEGRRTPVGAKAQDGAGTPNPGLGRRWLACILAPDPALA